MYNKSQPRTGHTREPDLNVRKGEFRKVVLRVLRAGSQLARVGKADEDTPPVSDHSHRSHK